MRGQETMTNEERFRGLKEQAIAENEKAYGEEARERYGDEAVDAANERVRAMSEEDWNEMRELEQAIIRQLKAAMVTGNPAGTEARELVGLHRCWICGHWGEGRYSAQAHLALGMYPDEFGLRPSRRRVLLGRWWPGRIGPGKANKRFICRYFLFSCRRLRGAMGSVNC